LPCLQADAIEINPLYLMMPVTISASFSYILPVSTPPNAIVYATGDITMIDMASTLVYFKCTGSGVRCEEVVDSANHQRYIRFTGVE
jgi:di/tricarboxylate transporter